MEKVELFDLRSLGKIEKGIFLERPNRFVGICRIKNKQKTCHIADPGRLKEILTEGREILAVKNKYGMKTDYKMIAAKMEDGWILLNTSFHSKIAFNAIKAGILGFIPESIKSEVKFGDSRLDYLVNNEIFIELKGSNLLIEKKCVFPDAPTKRGVKHLKELIKAKEKGYGSIILIMGLRNCNCFKTNEDLDPEFSSVFHEAINKGVKFVGFKIKIDENMKVVLNGKMDLCNGK